MCDLYGMVWYGMVWYGMVWYGMVRYVIWCGVVLSGSNLWFVVSCQTSPSKNHIISNHSESPQRIEYHII